jgi:hypothetical protein
MTERIGVVRKNLRARHDEEVNMVRKILFTMLVVIALILPLRAQENDELIREKVETVNVEIPVQVFADGKPVLDLKKEDFRLWEEGRPQAINGFYLVKKRIAGLQDAAPADDSLRSRYFVLAFRVYDFNDRLREGLAYLFQKILSPRDRLLVFVNEKTHEYRQVGDGDAIRAEIERDLRQQCREAYIRLHGYYRELERWTNDCKLRMNNPESRGESGPTLIYNFLKRYLEDMDEYKRRYLTQDIDPYYALAKHLEKIHNEKWVISFYQREMLPSLTLNGEMIQIVQSQISECEEALSPEYKGFYIALTQMLQKALKEAQTGVDFPAEEIGRFFASIHATFHSVLINTQVHLVGEDLEFRQLDSGLETSLRELTEKTGGKLIASTDLVSSLSAVAAAEDIYYVLTYAPSDPGKRGKIKLQVADDKYKLQYDGDKQPAYLKRYIKEKEAAIPAVRITGLDFVGRTLTLTIRDYARTTGSGDGNGTLDVHIRVQNERNETSYDQKKVFRSGGKTMALSLDFGQLSPGKYDILVEVLDQVSGKTCTEIIQPLLR